MTEKSKDQNKEAEDKFEATVKRMLKTPPKPHKPVKNIKTNSSQKD